MARINLTTEEQREIERIDAGEDAWVGEEVSIRRPPGGIKMGIAVRVRLTGDQYDQLRAAASRRGLGPSTLMRMWALEQLAREAEPARRK